MNDSENDIENKKKQHLSPYPVSRLSPAFELVDLAKEIARADDMLSLQTSGKLQLLAKQIRRLQKEAQKILEETRRNQEMHRVQCGFKKVPGKVYHLYRKEDGNLALSMLSPADWGKSPPYRFAGSFRLENDMNWTEIDTADSNAVE